MRRVIERFIIRFLLYFLKKRLQNYSCMAYSIYGQLNNEVIK